MSYSNCFLIHVYLLVSLIFICLLPSLASQKPVLRGNTSHASKSQPKYSCHLCPPYLPICGISPPLQVNFRVLPLKPSTTSHFVFMFLAHEDVKVIIVVFHALLSTARLMSFISLVNKKTIDIKKKKSWFDHNFQKGKKIGKYKKVALLHGL